MKTQMDFLGKDGAKGDVASLITQGRMDVGALRPYYDKDGNTLITVFTGGDAADPANYRTRMVANATLRRDEWMQLDNTVQNAAQSRLAGIQDLIDKGLVFNLGNAMGTTVLESHDVSDAFEAELSMDGVTRSKGDRVDFSTKYLPIPIIHVDYEINLRVLSASRNLGNPVDTTSAERASRKVAETLENMLFKNQTYSFGGGAIYSYINHPDRNPATLSKAWNAADKTGAEIVTEVLSLKQKAIDAKFYGPYMLYVPTAYETKLDEDYASAKDGTIRERILKIGNIQGVKVIDALPANNVVLVQMTSDVVRLVRGLPIQNVEWKSEGNFVTNYKVMTIQVPQIRSDYYKKCGIVHLA